MILLLQVVFASLEREKNTCDGLISACLCLRGGVFTLHCLRYCIIACEHIIALHGIASPAVHVLFISWSVEKHRVYVLNQLVKALF